MAGLLDSLMGSSIDDPKTLGLLQLAASLSSGPKFMPALSEGLLGRSQIMNNAEHQKAQQQMQQMQLQQAQRQMAQQQAQDQFRASIPSPQMQASQAALAGGGGPTVANAQNMRQVDPMAQMMHGAMQAGVVDPMQYLASLQPKPRKLTTVAPGASVIDENDPSKPLFTAPKEVSKPAALQEYEFAKGQGYGGSFLDFQLAQKRAGATAITVDQRGDNAYSAAQGKEYSDLMAGINKAAFTAPSQIRKLERMTQLLDGVDGGKLAPAGVEIASALNSFGIKIDPRLGNKEAAQALSRELAGGLRQPGTGPMTDKDFENFLQQIPDLSKSSAGRKQITATMKAALNRDIKIAQLAREYERKNGRIDGRFMDEVASFIAENPVVSAPVGWKVER